MGGAVGAAQVELLTAWLAERQATLVSRKLHACLTLRWRAGAHDNFRSSLPACAPVCMAVCRRIWELQLPMRKLVIPLGAVGGYSKFIFQAKWLPRTSGSRLRTWWHAGCTHQQP
eukprot:359606-Chlamydomonas_euryale.AAC.3